MGCMCPFANLLATAPGYSSGPIQAEWIGSQSIEFNSFSIATHLQLLNSTISFYGGQHDWMQLLIRIIPSQQKECVPETRLMNNIRKKNFILYSIQHLRLRIHRDASL
jgi:hypothetical protein